MRTPTVHINGTSRDDLENQQIAVVHAADKLLTALSNASPHARDYYVQDDMAAVEAAREHRVRIEAVVKIYNDAMDILVAIQKS